MIITYSTREVVIGGLVNCLFPMNLVNFDPMAGSDIGFRYELKYSSTGSETM